MEEIRINKNEDGTFVVEQDNTKSCDCGWDEMMGLLSAMTMPHERPCLQWLKKKEKQYKPHDGDFLMSKNGDYMFIYNENGECLTSFYVGFSIERNSLTRSGETIFDASGNHIEDYRPATEEEKQKFIERLHSEKIDWDSENKKVVDWEWEPKEGELIFFYDWCSQTSRFIACSIRYTKTDGQVLRDKEGNRFRTKHECLVMCDKLNEAIKNVK